MKERSLIFILGNEGGVVTIDESGELASFDRIQKKQKTRKFKKLPKFIFDVYNYSMIGLVYDHQHISTPREQPDASQLRNYRLYSGPAWNKIRHVARSKRSRLFIATDYELADQYGKIIGISASKFKGLQVFGELVISCHEDGTIKYWETKNKVLGRRRYLGVMSTTHGGFTEDGNYYFADIGASRKTKAGHVKTINLVGDGKVKTWMHDEPVGKAIFSRDGSRAMTYEFIRRQYVDDPKIKFWDVANEKVLSTLELDKARQMEFPVFSHDGTRFYCQLGDLGVIEIDVATGKKTKVANYYGNSQLGVNSKGELFRVKRNGRHSQVTIHFLKEDRVVETPMGENNSRAQLLVDFDGKTIANGWRFANVFRVKDGKEIFACKPKKGLHATVVSRDSQRVVIVAYEGIRIVDLESGYKICEWPGDQLLRRFNTGNLQISPDNRYILEYTNGNFIGPQPDDKLAKRKQSSPDGVKFVVPPGSL